MDAPLGVIMCYEACFSVGSVVDPQQFSLPPTPPAPALHPHTLNLDSAFYLAP